MISYSDKASKKTNDIITSTEDVLKEVMEQVLCTDL